MTILKDRVLVAEGRIHLLYHWKCRVHFLHIKCPRWLANSEWVRKEFGYVSERV